MGAVASVDEDALDKAACWLQKDDLLRLREISPHGRDTARRAIATRAIPDVQRIRFRSVQYVPRQALEMRARPQSVEAKGRVFGAGCVDLSASGTSTSSLAALWSFVKSTKGGLRELYLYLSGVTPELLLAMCRASPNLVDLTGPRHVPISDDTIVAIAAACPQLERARFSDTGADIGAELSPAERWQQYFPRLKQLTLYSKISARGPPYRPTLLENVSEAARNTSATEVDMEGCHVFPDLIDAIVGTPLGDRLTSLSEQEWGMDTNIEPDALLAAARGFPRLVKLWIPGLTRIPNPGWFSQLAGIRTFQTLTIESRHATDSHVVAACSQNPVVTLDLTWIRELTRGVIDGIISSQSAATLQDLRISYCQPLVLTGDEIASYMQNRAIRAADMLRLVRACPRLSTLSWSRNYSNNDQATYPELTEILELRGGEFRYHHG